MKKLIPVLILLLVGVLGVVGCGQTSVTEKPAVPKDIKPVPENGTERVVLLARIAQDFGPFKCNTYDPSSVDYWSGLPFRIVRVKEGKFPYDYVGCSAHSGTMLKFMILGLDYEAPEDFLIELILVWDPEQGMYKLESGKVVEEQE